MFVTLTKIDGTLSDITRYTKKLGQDSKKLTFTSGDSIYLGSRLKFNHAFISSTVYPVASVNIDINLWNGSEFEGVGRTIDETDGLVSQGIIEFSPDKDKSWNKEDTDSIAELSDIYYQNMYWIKIDLNSDDEITLDYIGHKFSNDFDLFSEHPELNNSTFLNYFSQDDFTKQAVIAGELIEKRLIKLGYATGIEQVLQWEDITLSSVSKVAQLVYTSFGNTYVDNVTALSKEFISRLETSFPIIDTNNSADKDTNQQVTSGLLYR